MKTSLVLAVLIAAAGAAAAESTAAVDACRTGRALEKPLRLSILPTNGSAPIELLLRYTGCFTTDTEPLFGDPVGPTAVRRYRADGIAWALELTSEDGTDMTEAYLYYVKPDSDRQYPVAYLKAAKTAAIGSGRVDWGLNSLMNPVPPEFSFSARVATQ